MHDFTGVVKETNVQRQLLTLAVLFIFPFMKKGPEVAKLVIWEMQLARQSINLNSEKFMYKASGWAL